MPHVGAVRSECDVDPLAHCCTRGRADSREGSRESRRLWPPAGAPVRSASERPQTEAAGAADGGVGPSHKGGKVGI